MARSKPCPLCGKPPSATHAPFCGQGCRDRDLMQWLGEGYAIPVSTPPGEEEDGLDTTPERD
ncbi:DNA gyrase inhibitor YacG [Sphingomonas sp. MMS24-J45]|uniref:DNA gyrase inhibitor YacG n=1 Tax=Sphingomonas sp. MMS24-J45 TaxID=3238806 RepID=UPI003850642B